MQSWYAMPRIKKILKIYKTRVAKFPAIEIEPTVRITRCIKIVKYL